MSKVETIKNIFYDPAGYGSMKNTLTDAKQVDPSIKLDDVKESFNECIESLARSPRSKLSACCACYNGLPIIGPCSRPSCPTHASEAIH